MNGAQVESIQARRFFTQGRGDDIAAGSGVATKSGAHQKMRDYNTGHSSPIVQMWISADVD